MKNGAKAAISEIFSSIQGEGLFVGVRQIFVRFARCNLSCRYCDTRARLGSAVCLAEKAAGSRLFEKLTNPVSVEDAARIIERLARGGRHHSVSFTGGEPLCEAAFLRELAARVRAFGIKVYLETNGALPNELRKVTGLVDVVAMDIKLKSATGQPARFAANAEFLKIARRKDAFVKVVFGRNITAREIASVAAVLKKSGAPLVLQPEHSARLSEGFILSVLDKFSRLLGDVRVIPQAHKLLGMR